MTVTVATEAIVDGDRRALQLHRTAVAVAVVIRVIGTMLSLASATVEEG